MSEEDFFLLLNCIKPRIEQDTSYRKAIPAEERLAITVRFLATGDSFTSLQYLFKVSKQLVFEIVPEVCQAIIECLRDYVQTPLTEEKWAHVWNFPKCVGAIDGKHVVLQAPINSGSEYINYKSHFSIVLMAAADADYNFTFVDIGCQGRISDGGVFANTILFGERRAWRNEPQSTVSFLSLRNVARKTKLCCQEARDEFAEYFMTNGAESWQNRYA